VHRARGGGRAARALMSNLAFLWRPRRLHLTFKFAAGRPRLDHISY